MPVRNAVLRRPLLVAAVVAALCAPPGRAPAATFIPRNVRVETSDRVLRFVSGEQVISTATLCPGFVFDQFGVSGPVFSPDLHWVLVDVIGPFTPGNVGRTHALVEVRTGGIVRAPDFPVYVGVPSTLDTLSWVSGERQTLHYAKGQDRALGEPLQPIPSSGCRA